jgi:hypothetical protein
MGAAEKLIDMAKSQIGYLEKSKAAYEADPSVLDDFKRGAGLDNYTKYARDQWRVRYFNSSKQGVAWCAVFVGWCFLQCFGKETALRLQCQPRSGNAGTGCGSASRYYKEKGRFRTTPEAGDQIFFRDKEGNVSHTGIVEKIEGGRVCTIEGNSDGMVTRQRYGPENERIYGYGHPDWSIVKDDGKESGESEEEGKTMERNAKVVPTSTSKGSTVNLRSQASTSGKILAKVPFESPVMVKEDRGDWRKVTWNGITGWMMANYIEYTDASDDEDDGEDAQPGEMITISRAEIEAVRNLLDGWLRGVVG